MIDLMNENRRLFAEFVRRYDELKARLAAAEKVVEIARELSTCNLTPCAPCICSNHPWAGPLDHEATCDDLRGELAELARSEKAYLDKRDVADTATTSIRTGPPDLPASGKDVTANPNPRDNDASVTTSSKVGEASDLNSEKQGEGR